VESLLCRLLRETNGEIDAAQRGIVSIDEIDKLGLVARAASRLVVVDGDLRRGTSRTGRRMGRRPRATESGPGV
jgi:hypothetical protein